MTDKSTAYRDSVKILRASVSKLIVASELVKRAHPRSQISAGWDSLSSLQVRVKHFVKKNWPLKVLDGVAGCYTDLADTITWILSNTERTAENRLTELNHLLVSLMRFYGA